MRVREAVASDLGRYMRMVRAFYRAGQFPFPLDVPRQNAIFEMSLAGGDRCRLWVVEIDGKAEGYLLATSSIGSLTGEFVASENMFWVEPGHRRGGKAADSLMGAFLAWARSIDAARVNASAQSSMRPKALLRFYRKHGLTETEIHVSRRLKE